MVYFCNTLKTKRTIRLGNFGKKLTLLSLIAGSAFVAFAALGDGKGKEKPGSSKVRLLSSKSQSSNFSLRSGYSFRGSEVINTTVPRYVDISSVITYQRGNTTYVLPLKKKVLVDNITISLGNRQFQHN